MSHISGALPIMPRLSSSIRRGRTLVSIGSRRVDKSVIVKFLIGSNKHSKNLIVSIGLIRTDSDYGRPYGPSSTVCLSSALNPFFQFNQKAHQGYILNQKLIFVIFIAKSNQVNEV